MNNSKSRILSNKMFNNIVAVVTALSLVFLQVPITNWSQQAAADVTDAVQEQLAETTSVDVGLAFENAYITYAGQILAPPATVVTIPSGSGMEFTAAADSGYQLESVTATIGGAEVELSPNGSGTYVLTASDVVVTSNIAVRAITAPAVEEVAVEEVATSETPDEEADKTADGEDGATDAAADDASDSAAPAAEERAEYTYINDDVTVTATLSQPGAVPADAVFQVTPITPSTAGYNYDVYMEALNSTDDADYTSDNTLLYDVAFMVPKTDDDGNAIAGEYVEYEPAAGTVAITMTFKQGQLVDELDATQASDVEIIHLPLSGSVLGSVDSTQDATNIYVGDVAVENVKDPAASIAGETVSFTLDSLSLVAVSTASKSATTTTSTLAAASAASASTSHNLADYLTSATINAPKNAAGQYEVTPGSSYSIILAFAENKTLQFPDDSDTMTYKLPAGLNAADGQQGTLDFRVNDGGTYYTISGNSYSIENGELHFNFNTSDPNYSRLTAASNAKFSVTFTGTFDESADQITFRDGISKNLAIDTTNGVSATKSAVFNKQNNTVDYTVSIHSTGLSKNVVVTDTIEGDALTLDAGSIQAWSNVNGSVNMTGGANGNSFSYTIPQMTNNEYITFKYSAKVDLSKLTMVNGKVVSTGKNMVHAKSDGDPDGSSYSQTTSIDYTPSISKSNGTITSENGTKKTMSWTITANADAKVSMAGGKVTDTIASSSQSFMKYSGDGIQVKVYDASGKLVRTDNVSWSNLTQKSDGSWTYTIPSSDSGKAYKYVIGYTTEVDVSSLNGFTSVQNSTSTDSGRTDSGSGVVGTGGNSGGGSGISDTTTPTVKMNKSVEEIDRVNKTISWAISFTVPAEGLTKAVLTDTFPAKSPYSESVIESSIQVSGLQSGEGYDISYQNNRWVNNVAYPSAVVLTFKNNGASGLVGTGSERTVTVRLQTELSDDWLNAVASNGWYLEHDNNAGLDTNYNYAYASATAKVSSPTLKKAKNAEQTRQVDGVNLPMYYFVLTLTDVSSDVVEIDDVFDTDLLMPYSDQYHKAEVVGGTSPYWPSDRTGTAAPSMVETPTGMKIVLTGDSLPKADDGSYYPAYRVGYWLTVKDVAALNRLIAKAAESEGGKYTFSNKAEWSGQTGTVDITYAYDGLKKEILTPDSELKKTDDDVWAEFRITLNPGGQMLNGGQPLTMTDTFTNLSLDYTSIKAEPADGVSWDVSGNTATYTLPDQTPVVITYKARVIYTDIGEAGDTKYVSFSNVAEMNGYRGEVKKTAERHNSGSGAASVPAIKLLKYKAGDMTKRLDGAVFALLDADKNPVTDKFGEPVKFTTDSDGLITVRGDEKELGWTIESGEQYYLHEEKAPDGYMLADFDYSFIVTEDGTTDYQNYIYHTGDTMSAKNYPGTDVQVTKQWSDGNDKHNADSVTVQLQQKVGAGDWSNTIRENVKVDGQYTWVDTSGKTATLNAGNGWKATFNGLPLTVPEDLAYNDSDDVPVEYRVVETQVNGEAPEEGSVTVTRSGEGYYAFTISNQAEEKVSVPVSKEWNDEGNQDGIRPKAVTVKLLADGKESGKTAELNADNNWSYTFEDLDKTNDSGAVISYTVDEAVPSGYAKSIEGSVEDGFTITNTHAPAKTAVSAKKVWSDGGNQDGIRPATVQLRLLADGSDAGRDPITLSDSNNWADGWTDLPQRSNGKDIVYTVEETSVPSGYAVTYSTEGATLVATNAHTPEETSVSVKKEWSDADDQDGLRAESVTVNLMANGVKVDSVVLSAQNNWQHTFDKLAKKKDGTAITYTVEEESVPSGYTAKVTGSVDTGFTITNSHTPDKTGVSVTKVWDDSDNRDNVRPESITVQLKANGANAGDPVVLNEGNNWKHTWPDLAKNAEGTAIVYTVDEVTEVPGYKTTVAGDMQTGFVITNAHDTDETSVSVSKAWSDADDQDGIRPKSVTVQLKADGVAQGAAVTLNEGNNWSYTWEKLPLNKAGAVGQAVAYTVEEVNVATGYKATVTGGKAEDGTFSYTVTNTHNAEVTSITGTKVWDDANDQDGLRAAAGPVQLQLNANGVAVGQPVEVNAANNWTATWDNLPVNAGGNAIAYTVTEVGVPEGYAVDPGTADNNYKVTNTYAPGKTSVSVTKVWQDQGDFDGLQPEEITVQLKADGVNAGSAVTLNADNHWTYTWTDLDKKAGGQDISYTVEESGVPDGYSVESSGGKAEDGTFAYTIVNTHTPQLTSVSVKKAWDDADNQDGKRAPAVTVKLVRSDGAVTEQVLSESNSWSYSWTDLPTMVGGQAVSYDVEEASSIDGYDTSIEVTDGTYVITNAHVPEKTYAKVTKTWNDADDQDGKRAATVQLMANTGADGAWVAVGDPVTVGTESGWTHDWSDLDKYHAGSLVTYKVVETSAPEGYSADIAQVSAEGFEFTIANSYTPEKTSVTVSKAWVDDEDHDGLQPGSIQVQLYANNEASGDPVTLSADNSWTYTWTDLDKNASGQPISYDVAETAVPGGYVMTKAGGALQNGTFDYTITNTHTPTYTSASVTKVWNDASDQDGLRPEGIQVQLYANGEPYGDAVTLADGAWSYEWLQLPTIMNGKDVVYTINEVSTVEGYAKAQTSSFAEDGSYVFTVTNTHTPETVDIPVAKVWDDKSDQDRIRPEAVTVKLLANGADTGKTVTLNQGNSWKGSFTGLAKKTNGADIVYTVEEALVPAGYQVAVSGTASTGFKVTNTHDVETTEVSVKKSWQDADDQDGIRPDGVSVQLYANGEAVGQPVTLDSRHGWEHTWTGLDKNAAGEAIEYTVDEVVVPDGYSKTSVAGGVSEDGNGTFSYTVTNAHVPETTQITGTKQWDDADNQDGKRADTVQLQLNANGNPVGAPVTVGEAQGWSHTWEDLAVKSAGEDIVYTVTESGTAADYSVTPGASANDYAVTNSYTPGKTSVSVAKVWADGNDQDGMRPSAIQVQLKADDEAKGEVVTLNESNGWSYTWTDLDKMSAGTDISYTVEEVATPTGYTASVSGGKTDSGVFNYTVTNTHVPEKTTMLVAKAWDDAGNQDGIRPSSISVTLLANGAEKATVQLSDANNWTYLWDELPMYQGGQKVTYTLKEVAVPAGYTQSVQKLSTTKYAIVNVHTPETVSIPVTKVWDDADNQDGIRPDSVSVQLKSGEDTVGDAVELNAGNGWSHTFADLPKYAHGVEIPYSVEEVGVAAYRTTTTGNVEDGFTITNAYTPATTQATAVKVWDDAQNQDGIRPASVMVQLHDDDGVVGQPVELNASNNWTHTWNNLPVKRAGKELTYSVSEADVASYSADVADNGAGTFTVTNSYTPGTTSASVTKVWSDGDNRDRTRPDSIQVQLKADGQNSGDPVTLDQDNQWHYTWSDLPEKADGQAIVYTVEEVTELPAYATTVQHADNAYTITNTYTPETVTLSALKVWDDDTNRDNIRPASATLQLKANGQTVRTLELNAGNDWSASIADLPKNEDGVAIDYTLGEADVPEGYEFSFSTGEGGVLVGTNTHAPETVSIPVTKTWADAGDQDGKRPESITVNLMNGDTVVRSATLDASNSWTYTFEDLPKLEAGEPIDYTVSEVSVKDYSSTVTGSMAAGFTIANAHTPETTTIAAVKAWNDANNQDGIRPGSVTVQLKANGEVQETATLNAANGWRATWSDLPVYEDGVAIDYQVVEEGTLPGYTSSVADATADGVRTFTVTNAHTPETVSIPVQKVWSDDNDRDDLRPASIVVNLMNGSQVAGTVTLDESNGWTGSFQNLPKYANGQEINYTVEEAAVTGYTAAVAGSVEAGFTVTNTHTAIPTSKTVRKVWQDNDDQDGVRPDSVFVQLFDQGGAYGSPVELNEDNDWTYTWDDLPLNYENGVTAVYSVGEVAVSGYTTTTSTDENGAFVITNSYTPGTTTVSAAKVWDDADDQDGLRPGSVDVTLYADGAQQETVTLYADNQWHYEWTGLPEYRDGGVAIVYTVEEAAVDNYDTAITNTGNAFTVTNTHTPETTQVAGSKAWSDAHDQDGLRKDVESVALQLKADGVAVGEPVQVGAAEGWSHTWEGLAKYRDAGTEVAYTVEEVGVPAGYQASTGDADNGYTVTNTHKPEQTQVSVKKRWIDAANQDGMRAPVTVTLYADGEAEDSFELNDANGWQHTFTGLDKYRDGGTQIAYTVEESGVEGYEAAVTGDAESGFTFTNTHVPDTTSVAVSKEWDDADNQDGVRPHSVMVQLYANGTAKGNAVALDDSNNWSYSWDNLDKRAGGAVISYTVAEVESGGYQPTVTGGEQADGTFTYVVTNAHTPETTQVTGSKAWDDADDQDGLRKDVESVALQLKADGVAVGEPVQVGAAEGWSHTWEGLAKYRDAGTEVAYTVEEVGVPAGYQASTGDADNGYTVTNTHKPAVTSATVTKEWDDADNQDGKRASSVTVQLVSNKGAYGNPVTLHAGNGWSYTWDNLPVYQAGEAVTYSVVETNVPDDYQASVTGSVAEGFTVKNAYTPDVRNVTVVKAWDDASDQDGLRPDAIEVQLLADGTAQGDSVQLSADNNWSYTWTDLAKYRDAGTEIAYTISEVSVPDGYATATTGSAAEGFVVTNTYVPETTNVGVSKKWSDADDQDGVRPVGALLTLYADGVAVGSHSVVAGDRWAYEFTDLAKYRDGGTEIVYTVGEDEVDGNYAASIEGLEVTNTHETEKVDVSGTKTWIDADNAAGNRPQSVTVYLLADGKRVAETVASEASDWTYSFTGLDKYRDGGTEIVYTVAEQAVEGYTSAVDGYDITNTQNAVVEFVASKALDGRTLNPGEFTFELLQNGEVVQSIQNAGDGHARFDAIEYTPADRGAHAFQIREVRGDLNGVTYDSTVYEVTATVVQAEDGSLSVEYDGYDPGTGAEFTNTYAPSGSVVLEASKVLEGAPLTAGAYTFQVADTAGNVYATATNDADGTVTFPALSFSAAGKYKYVISEVVPTNAQQLGPNMVANGVAYDGNQAGVTIEAIDNFDGTLRFNVTYDTDEAAFVNATVPDAVFPLTAKKAITGRDFHAGDEFTFTVEAADGAPLPENTQVTIAPTSGSEAAVDFGDITFTTDDLGKSYTYTVREAGAGQTDDGLTNDPFAHYVTLTVNDAGDGTMRVDAAYQAGADDIVFTNTYEAAGQAVVQATKLLQGRALADNEFFFELTGDSLEAPMHAHAAADGSIVFDPISYTQADAGKDFAYTISETQGTLGGVTYDTSSYGVTVHVTDNGDGTLGIAYDYDQAPVFTNVYRTEGVSVALSAQKMLVGGELQGGEFSFTLLGASANTADVAQTVTNDAQGAVAFDELSYDAPGVYEYRIFEVVPTDAVDNGDDTFTGSDGVVYDGAEHTATVTVTDDGYGKLAADVAYDGGAAAGISFGNTALARTGFEFDKYFFGGVGTFDFTLTAVDASGAPRAGQATDYSAAASIVDDGQSAFTATVQNGAYSGNVAKVVFPEISYAADGDYYYLVEEAEGDTSAMVADDAQYLAHVVVAGGQVSSTTFNLLYKGEDLGPTTDLSFYNNSAVTLGFNSLSAQSYADEAQRVSVYPKAKKYLNGSTDQLVGGDFAFELIDEESGQVIAQATNDEAGNVAFFDEDTDPGLAYDEPGVWQYLIREVAGDEAGMVYDDSTILVTVSVVQTDEGLAADITYNGPGGAEPAFYNTKEGIDVEVYKVSRFGGEGLDNCTYALWMAGENGDAMIQEATSDETGRIIFRNVALIAGQKYFFKEVEAPKGHTVDPYRTAYFSLNEAGDALVLVEDTASDGWHSATENIELDKARGEEN